MTKVSKRYDMYLVPGSWLTAPPNPGIFLSNESNGSIFCYDIGSVVPSFLKSLRSHKGERNVLVFTTVYANKVTFRKHLQMGAGYQKSQPWLECGNLWLHTMISKERKGTRDSNNPQWPELTNNACVMTPP